MQSDRIPINVATKSTVDFITEHVDAPALVLEVGCGEGHVAAALMARGYRVTGVDTDAAALEKARQRRVRVVAAEWPDYAGEAVDAVAFTRSLHHVHRLDEAVARARELISRGGKLLVEDFAFADTDRRTIGWFMNLMKSDEVRALILPVSGEFVTRLLEATDPCDAWHDDHGHDLHTIDAMKDAIVRHFNIAECVAAPYLYRYLVPVLPATPEAWALVQRALEREIRAGASGDIALIGRRVVAG